MTDKLESSDKFDQPSERRVTVPLFPKYPDVRSLLRFWEAKKAEDILGLRKSIQSLCGTPQKPVDWSNPQTWISERLKGKNRKLASEIWNLSNRTVNPRHTDGAWILCRRFNLLIEKSGVLELTGAGQDFLQNEFGKTEIKIDSLEGIFELLRLIEDYEPCQPKHLLSDWATYLIQHSNNKTESVFKDTLNRRLVNMMDRGLICKSEKNFYRLSDSSRLYLSRIAPIISPNEQDELVILAKKRKSVIKNQLRERLSKIDPADFEKLIGHLLLKMQYQDVTTTSSSGDAGVDVVASIEMGITSVKEVVQVKRHKRTIQRIVLDALRGSLRRFDAVRGSIITTSSFSRGTIEAATAHGEPPITLIDGETLIDLLIEHELGVQKQNVEVLRVDSDFFSTLSDD